MNEDHLTQEGWPKAGVGVGRKGGGRGEGSNDSAEGHE